jgi:RHS repeat-associated protein
MTDNSGAVVWSADYKPFGEATITVSTITNNLRFPGQYYDAETGLNYNYFRDYDPATGRYIERDAMGIRGGINIYAYVRNRPINRIDPRGLMDIDPTGFYDSSGVTPSNINGGLIATGAVVTGAGLLTVATGGTLMGLAAVGEIAAEEGLLSLIVEGGHAVGSFLWGLGLTAAGGAAVYQGGNMIDQGLYQNNNTGNNNTNATRPNPCP